MLAFAAFAIVVGANHKVDRVLRNFREEVEYVVWTPRGTVVAITKSAVTELPSGRSRRLRRFSREIDDPIRRSEYRLLLNASRTKAIGKGFVLDLRTLTSSPLARAAAWEGDRLVEIDSPALGRYRMFRNGHLVSVAPGWFVLGISDDLRLALACRKDPFDGDTTSLLRLNARTGRASILASYKGASDDHQWLSWVQDNGPRGPLLIHAENLAADLTTPYLAGPALRPIDLRRPEKRPLPTSLTQTSATVEWINPATPWALVRRTVMLDQSAGFDASTLDLWNSKSGASVRLAKVTAYWKAGTNQRGLGATIGAYALDWPSRRLAYVVASPENNRVLIRSAVLQGLGYDAEAMRHGMACFRWALAP
jgi:hypothetical protein